MLVPPFRLKTLAVNKVIALASVFNSSLIASLISPASFHADDA